MERVLEDLEHCSEFEELTQALCKKEHILATKGSYPGCNPRVLLSSFMIARFPDIVFANSTLIESAKAIAAQIMAGDNISPDDSYFAAFHEWKADDSEKLQIEISSGITMLEDMKVQEEADEADLQWNHGISENIRRMQECKTKLASFSPPTK